MSSIVLSRAILFQWNRKRPPGLLNKSMNFFDQQLTHKLLIMCSRWIQIRGDSGRRRLHHHLEVEGCEGRQ